MRLLNAKGLEAIDNDRTVAKGVIAQISAFSATNLLALKDQEAVEAARAAYEGLTAAQKEFVNNLAVLDAAEAKMAALQEQEAKDKAAAKVVDDMIAALPAADALTLDDKAAVTAVRDAYQDLTLSQRGFVENLSVLEAAEAQMKKLENPFIPGDVNDDGIVDNKDYGLLQRYLNDWAVTINEDAADVNRDEKINNKDYSLLQRYLNNWEITLQ